MNVKTIGLAFAAAAMATGPAFAQDTSGQMSGQSGSQTGSMPASGDTGSSSMSSSGMTKSQMATMKKCQAMSSDMMMKNKKCASMAKMHPEMMQGAGTSPSQ
jgi:hypothetical protein